MISFTHVELMKFVMNNNPTTLDTVSANFNKTPHYIRSEIQQINDFLGEDAIDIKNSKIQTSINYERFSNIMKSLDFSSYIPSQQERLDVVIVKSFFEGYCNLTQLYTSWNLSLTTKKRDMHKLEESLQNLGLMIEKKPGYGIRIVGDILHYRVLIIRILIFCTDVANFRLERREANTPIENLIFDVFWNHIDKYTEDAESIISNFLNEYQHDINYYSKKFFISYVLLALFKSDSNIVEPKQLKLQPLNLYLFSDPNENRAFNQVASMIDFNPSALMPHNAYLYSLVKNLYHTIIKQLDIKIKTLEDAIQELYIYIYRQYFNEHFHYVYEDKLVKKVELYYPEIHQVLLSNLSSIENFLDFKMNEEHLTSITLIVSKWILKNRYYSKKQKGILLVTNIAFERVSYFIEELHEHIDFKLVDTIDINEVGKLSSMKYDLIMSFSNRIKNVLANQGYDSIKVNYFITQKDIQNLLNLGFEKPRHLLDTERFIGDLRQDNPEDLSKYLKEKYPFIFN